MFDHRLFRPIFAVAKRVFRGNVLITVNSGFAAARYCVVAPQNRFPDASGARLPRRDALRGGVFAWHHILASIA